MRVPAPGARLQIGHDVLAAPSGLERGWRLGAVAPAAAEQAPVEEPAGLDAGGDRLLSRQSGSAGPKSWPSPVDRARPGSKHHVITDGQGIPLAVSLTGGNRNDVTQLLPLLDKIPAVAGVVGRPRRRPDMLFAGRGYDHDKYRPLLRERGIRPVIAEDGQAPDEPVDQVDDGQLSDGSGTEVLAFRVASVSLGPAPRGAYRDVRTSRTISLAGVGSAVSVFAAGGDRRTAHGSPVTGGHQGRRTGSRSRTRHGRSLCTRRRPGPRRRAAAG